MTAAKKIYTVEDWLNLDDEARCELIEGEFVYKSMPSAEHGLVQRALAFLLGPFHRKTGGGGGPGGWWIITEAQVLYPGRQNGFIHDLAGWRRDRHAHKPAGKKIEMKPDWVCEILSDNRKHDLTTKKWVLHEHRVEFFWLIDLQNEILSILKWSQEGYVTISDVTPGKTIRLEPFHHIEIDTNVLFGGDPD